MNKIPLCNPAIGETEKALVAQCLESGYVSSIGPMVEMFEQEFKARFGCGAVTAVNSGTAALHLAMRLAGIGPGDMVAVPDLTFVASANPVLYCGAEPVFLDVSPRTWTLDPQLLADVCKSFRNKNRPVKAVVPVHIFGGVCDMPAINQVAREYDLIVIEDATESLGATVARQHAGACGDMGCFSFNGNKMITTGAGGMLATRDTAAADRARLLSTQARSRPDDYFHSELGFNYRMSSLAAALGLAQLRRFDELLERKIAIGMRYRHAFRDLKTIKTQEFPKESKPCYWLNSIVLEKPDSRDRWLKKLDEKGVAARRFFRPLHAQQYFNARVWTATRHGAAPRKKGESDRISAAGINLPSSAELTTEQQNIVIEAVLSLAQANIK